MVLLATLTQPQRTAPFSDFRGGHPCLDFQTMCLNAKLLAVKLFPLRQEGVPLFHNAEVAPPRTQDLKSGYNTKTESQLSVLTLSPGESLTICNKYEFKVLPH